jgi:putative transposase
VAAGAGRWRPGGTRIEGRGRGGVQAVPAQLRELEALLDAGPAAWGWDEDQCWTLARIAEVVRRRFGVGYTLAGMDLLLHRDRVERAGPRAAGRGAGRGSYCPVAGGDLAGGKRTAADLGAWIVFEDESGQGLRPPGGRTRGRRGTTPVVRVAGGSNKRVSLAALICIKPGQRPRLIYRVHKSRRGKGQCKGFTEADYARLLDAARQQLAGPLVVVWDNLNSRLSVAMAELIAARDGLTVCQLPPYAHELNPVEPAGRT